jgi:hypothetical protein
LYHYNLPYEAIGETEKSAGGKKTGREGFTGGGGGGIGAGGGGDGRGGGGGGAYGGAVQVGSS